MFYAVLLGAGLLTPVPDHSGLFLGAESQLFIKAGAPGAEPEQLDLFESRVIENALNDGSADALLLVRLVDDDIPDRRPIDKIRQYSTEANQKIAVPCAKRDIGMAKHLCGVLDRSILRPWGLVEQPKQMGCVEFFLF